MDRRGPLLVRVMRARILRLLRSQHGGHTLHCLWAHLKKDPTDHGHICVHPPVDWRFPQELRDEIRTLIKERLVEQVGQYFFLMEKK